MSSGRNSGRKPRPVTAVKSPAVIAAVDTIQVIASFGTLADSGEGINWIFLPMDRPLTKGDTTPSHWAIKLAGGTTIQPDQVIAVTPGQSAIAMQYAGSEGTPASVAYIGPSGTEVEAAGATLPKGVAWPIFIYSNA